MFDLSFGELAIIAVVALLVLGPERLPTAARTVGALLRKLRNGWQGVRSEIERELAAEDLKREIRDSSPMGAMGAESPAAAEQIKNAVNGETGKPPSNEQS